MIFRDYTDKISNLLVAGINLVWKLYLDARKLLLNSKSRGRIRGMFRTFTLLQVLISVCYSSWS